MDLAEFRAIDAETPLFDMSTDLDAKGILYEWGNEGRRFDKNYCQIVRRDIVGNDENHAADIVVRRMKELKRDIEAVIVGNQGYNAGASGTARRSRSLESFIGSTQSRGSNGEQASHSTEPAVDGETRVFDDQLISDALANCLIKNQEPTVLMMSPRSDFTDGDSLVFGNYEEHNLTVRFNRFQRHRSAFLLTPEDIRIAWLRKPQVKDLARTGDSIRKYCVAEFCLVIDESKHAVIADLD